MSGFLLGVPGKLKTLLDRLTADRAARLDEVTATRMGHLDTNVASRATQASVNTALTDLTTLQQRLTATRGSNLDYLDAPISGIGGGGSVIKSVQRGTANIPGGSTQPNITVAISSVNTLKSFLLIVDDNDSGLVSFGWLSGSTQITLGKKAFASTTIYWQVIEYE